MGPLDLRQWFKREGFYSIDWINAGGESGGASRPMHPDWITGLLHQCNAFDVPFHFKQWGHWVPVQLAHETARTRLIEFENEQPVEMVRLRKKFAGRILEGVTWDGVPHPPQIHA